MYGPLWVWLQETMMASAGTPDRAADCSMAGSTMARGSPIRSTPTTATIRPSASATMALAMS